MGRPTLCLLLLPALATHALLEQESGPWIGILGLPASVECDSADRLSRSQQAARQAGTSCFSNVYDKWVQAAGARVVGIPHNAVDEDRDGLDALLASLDGVLFTGGELNLADTQSAYYRTGSYIFDWVKRTNDAGSFYPLHGHCMGFQFLSILAAGGNSSVLQTFAFDSENISLPLEWTNEAWRSRWVQRMPGHIMKIFTAENSTTNLHHDGVAVDDFFRNPLLPEFFDVISINRDRKGRAFISTVESKQYPIQAMQWHPERNQFEWTHGLGLKHSTSVVAANAWVGADFADQARRRGAKPRNEALLRRFSTYGMQQVPVGDVLDGVSFLMFHGFGTSSGVSTSLRRERILA